MRELSYFLLISVLLFPGCAETLRELPSAGELDTHALQAGQEYVVGPGDVLQVTVWRQEELSVPSLVVRTDGKISMPLLDDVHAAGRTPTQLKAAIAEGLSEYVKAPTVTVVVREIHSKLVFVIGEVAREGPISFRAEMRVVDAISIAGGFSNFAGKSRIKVIRERNGQGPVEFLFNYDRFVDGKHLEQNILLLPGDRIIVPPQSPFWN